MVTILNEPGKRSEKNLSQMAGTIGPANSSQAKR